MNAVTIPVTVGADRRLIIDLPPSTPEGPADVVVVPHGDRSSEAANPAREVARAKLLAADFLTADTHAPDAAVPLSNEALARLGQLSPGARPSEALVMEDRGAY